MCIRDSTDADDMYNNWASDTECCKYLEWNVHKNIDETKTLLEFWIKAYDEGCYNWVVYVGGFTFPGSFSSYTIW